MRDSDLKKSWKAISSKIDSSSMGEIEAIFKGRTKKVTDSFFLASNVGMVVFPLACAALIYCMLNRWDDIFYRYNAMFLFVYYTYKLYNSIAAFYRIRYVGPNLPLKDWLKKWVRYKVKYVDRRVLVNILPIPVLMTSLYLAIYLYIRNETITELLSNPKFSIAFLVALISSRIAAILIRRNRQSKQLQYLKDMYDEIHANE